MAQAQLDVPASESDRRHAAARPRLMRSRHNRIIGGVAGGVAAHLGAPVWAVRLTFVALVLAAGFGLVVYLLLWLLAPLEAADAAPSHAPPAAALPTRPGGRQLTGALLVIGGVIAMLWLLGFTFEGNLFWPIVLGAIGFAVIWARTGDERRRWDPASLGSPLASVLSGGRPLARLIGGGILIVAGMAIVLAATTDLSGLMNVVLAVMVTVAGLALLVGPWVWNLGQELITERTSRVRSEARAEMAAHLHDSVLQTLALIQRAREPREMAMLARTQERELRAWLYGRAPSVPGVRLRDALDAMAGRIERSHAVKVETVVVGDAAMDEAMRALVAATSEATLNAASHSGAAEVSVYVEVEADAATAFVRDHGAGFDPDAVPSDRRGIADSIVGRMQRHGGSADVVSGDDGTEVRLRLPRSVAA
ncbi:MAG TPA: PspC domain-containing protein [Candidatus Limnocylindria bacterium]|nr:PspC domain-containing protein [Candidatus Limnocylindria bacterium]